jgi:predicted transcriptional regulator
MAEKKIFSTRLDAEVIKDLKHLAVDLEKSLGKLLEEAIEDLVLKYRGREEK